MSDKPTIAIMYPIAPLGVVTSDHRMLHPDAQITLRDGKPVPVFDEIEPGSHSFRNAVGKLTMVGTGTGPDGTRILWGRVEVDQQTADKLVPPGRYNLQPSLDDAIGTFRGEDEIMTFGDSALGAVVLAPVDQWPWAGVEMPPPVVE